MKVEGMDYLKLELETARARIGRGPPPGWLNVGGSARRVFGRSPGVVSAKW